MVTSEGLDGFEGAVALLSSQVVERALEETESLQLAIQPAVEEDGLTVLEECVEEEYEEVDKEEEKQDNEEEDNHEKKNPNEEM